MTENDMALIGLLRRNARMPVSELARHLNVSRTTIQDRLKRLENNGVIAGYTVRLGMEDAERGITAFVTIEVQPQLAVATIAALKRIATIESLYTVSGKVDLIAIVRTQSVAAMDRVLDTIGALEGVQKTDSSIVLSTKLNRNAPG